MPKPARTTPIRRPILIASNSPHAGTGYGMQTAQLAIRLKQHGHPVAIASNYGQEGSIGEWRGIKVLPRGLDMYSNDVIAAYQQLWTHENGGRDALVLTLFDVWVFTNPAWDHVPQVLSWVPIDHTPAPPRVIEFLAKPNVSPVAMSKFGAQMISAAGLDTHYAPHALDKVFKPTPAAGGMTGRQILSVPDDAFVVFTNAANKGNTPARKSWDTNAIAMSMFMAEHPEVYWYIHSERDGSMGGIALLPLLAASGVPEDRVRFTEPFAYRMGLPQVALAAMYSASDVLLATSLGEGFGVPTIEAQACGCPVICSDWTASPELCGDGWKVEGQPSWDHPQQSWWMIPSVGGTLSALQAAYERGPRRGVPSQTAIDFAKQYDADVVFAREWAPILAEYEL